MTEPFINLYRTKEEAFYFRNSQENRFYNFEGVHLLPNNTLKYVQVTNTPDGLNLEDWTVVAVDLCDEVRTNISDYFLIEKLTNSVNGDPQFYWSLLNVPFDFGDRLIYLEITQTLGETFYSTPFLLTDEGIDKTTQFHYKEKRVDEYQSIGLKTWFRQSTKQTELTTYYESSTKNTVTQAVQTSKIDIYHSELMDIDTLIKVTDVLENPYLYLDLVRGSLFEAVSIPDLTAQENFAEIKFQISTHKGDKFFGDADYSVIDYGTDYNI